MTGPDREGIQAVKPARALPTRQLNGSGNTAERRSPTVLSPLVVVATLRVMPYDAEQQN